MLFVVSWYLVPVGSPLVAIAQLHPPWEDYYVLSNGAYCIELLVIASDPSASQLVVSARHCAVCIVLWITKMEFNRCNVT